MMPLDKDPKGGGTNADGSISDTYCSLCYQQGTFTRDISVKEMRKLIIDKMVEMKYQRWVANFMTLGLPRLERWKQQK